MDGRDISALYTLQHGLARHSQDFGGFEDWHVPLRYFFDRISHPWLQDHIPMDKTILKKWLAAGYMEEGVVHPTEAGTPQGSVTRLGKYGIRWIGRNRPSGGPAN